MDDFFDWSGLTFGPSPESKLTISSRNGATMSSKNAVAQGGKLSKQNLDKTKRAESLGFSSAILREKTQDADAKSHTVHEESQKNRTCVRED
jgi:hypothetical protein